MPRLQPSASSHDPGAIRLRFERIRTAAKISAAAANRSQLASKAEMAAGDRNGMVSANNLMYHFIYWHRL
jgi:hypothetical protein